MTVWQLCYIVIPGKRDLVERKAGTTGPSMTRDHHYFVYILASQRNGTLYVGVTSDLIRRVQEHREGLVPGFTKRHAVKLLVYFEAHRDINEAILREKRIKRWRRKWKLDLIEAQNPQWRDLWIDLTS
jgi:putative endonuclease